jgi:hypothetical protein
MGEKNSFILNSKPVGFEELIRKASQMNTIRRMAFFFDCCLLECEGIRVCNIKKEHMTLYSAPPDNVAYHQYGVSLMVTCLVDILQCFKGSMNELQSKLRDKLKSKMLEVLRQELATKLDEDKVIRDHLPHSTSSMFDINLCAKISKASKSIGGWGGGGSWGCIVIAPYSFNVGGRS